ncbi:MAG: hypothetical protein ABJN62_19565 [Halioglobus sp.]
MTEAELLEAASNNWSDTISLLTLFISVMSGYLVVAYLVGKELKTSQVVLVNFLYGAFISFCLFAIYQMSATAVEHGILASDLSTQRSNRPQTWIPIVFLVIMLPMILASFKFMWDIRHPKAE